jgi:hypothetical protein
LHITFLFASFDPDLRPKKMSTLGFLNFIVKNIKPKVTQPLPTKGVVA